MDNIFILNSAIDSVDIKDAICERLIKARAITSCLLTANDDLVEAANKCFYGAVLAIDDYLEEIELLENQVAISNKNMQ